MPVPDLTGGGHSLMLSLPRPADTGKPIIYDPQFVTKADNDRISGCTPGSSCRLQVLGVIQNNGAVELRVSAFSW